MKQYFKFNSIGADHWRDALIWEYYGYWHLSGLERFGEKESLPEWYSEALAEAKKYVGTLKKPKLVFRHTELKGKDYNRFSIYDKNNPKIEPFTVNICKKNNDGKPVDTLAYARQRTQELKHLHNGDIEAHLFYQKSKIPVRPNWNTNKIDSYGYRLLNGKWRKNYIPTLEEIQKQGVA